MQVTRIVIDGLWRCLCPSIDSCLVSPINSSLRRSSIRPTVRPTEWALSQPSKSSFSRSVHGKASTKLEEQGYGPAVQAYGREKSTISSAFPKASPSYGSLDNVPPAELYDALRNIGTKDGTYESIIDIVEYLIKSRGETPSLLHYDALIRANVDASKGSADAVANLLREVKEENILPDSNLYHNALQVCCMA
jgi:hypothetical protein